MKSPFLGHCLQQKWYLTGGKRWKIVRYQNQSGLFQCSIKCTQINPGLSLGLQGGSKSTSRAGIAMKPKLARSCWFNTKVPLEDRKRQTGWAAQGSLILVSPQQGVLPRRSIQQGARHSWLHLRLALAGLVLKSYRPWSKRNVPSCDHQNITCWFEVLWASVEGPCLHKPGNWLMRQLIDLWAKAGIWNRIY
jgi:hypothetical protein